MEDIENIIDDFDDVLEVDDESTAVEDMEDFINSDSDAAEAAIFDTSEMPDELRSEIEEIEGSMATFETEFEVADAEGNSNAVIDPTADYIPEDFDKIEERMGVDQSVIEHEEVLDATTNLNENLSPREITGEPTPTPEAENDLEGNTPEPEPVEAEAECYGCGEEVGTVSGEVAATESDEVEEEYPSEDKEEKDVEEIKDEEDLETAQAAAEEQVAEDSVDEGTEQEEDAFANVSEMADVNVGDSEEEPTFVHEGEEVRPGVTSETPEEPEAVSNESVDFDRFIKIAFNRK